MWFTLLGTRPLFRPDEGRYAEIPREMVASGDWLVPHLNGLVYIEKPPLQYWVTAGFFRVLGTEPWVARLAPALSAALGVVLLGWAARRLWGPGTAAVACAACASAPLYFLVGQQLTLDMLFTFFLTAAVATFCVGQSVRADRARCRRWMMLSWAAIACAVMTKGIAALAIPALVLIAYSVWQKDVRVWDSSYLGLGLGLCLVLVAPWFIAISRAVPGFGEFFFIHEHLLRYTTLSADRYEPWWFFIAILLVGTAPWLPQIVTAWRTRNDHHVARGDFDARRVLWVWAAVVLFFFSASKSKLVPYVLPIVPVMALLIAGSKAESSGRNARLSALITLATAAAVGIGLMAYSLRAHEEKQRALADLATPGFIAVALLLALSGIAGLLLMRKLGARASLASIAIGWFSAGAVIVGWAAAAAGPLYSSESMARSIATRVPAPRHIYSVNYYEQTLPFYLGRTIDLVDFRGELDFGLGLDPARVITLDEFRKRWQGETDACAMMSREAYQRLVDSALPMTVIERDLHYVLVGRQ